MSNAARAGRVSAAFVTVLIVVPLVVLLSTVLYVLIAIWYVAPRLAKLPLEDALQPLVALHATRHIGLVFLVPNVVGNSVPRAFAAAAATATSWPGCWPCWRWSRCTSAGRSRWR